MPAGTARAPRWTAEWSDLIREVVDAGRCTGCSGCVLACPRDYLRLNHTTWRPMLLEAGRVDDDAARCVRGEKGCTLCTRACPRFGPWETDADTQMFGRARDISEVAGIYRGLYLVEALDSQIAAAGQDGGLGTALLSYALAHEYIDGALVSYYDEKWRTIPGVATTVDELVAAAGSRYTYSPNTLALRGALDRGLSRLGLMSVGCQTSVAAVAAARGARKMSRNIALTVGLLCSKTFEEAIFEDLLERRYGVFRHEVTKINIKGRLQVWIDRATGADYIEVPLKEAREWTRAGCLGCPDFAAEHADISLGGIGAFPGKTLTVVRSDLGEELLTAMQRDGWIAVADAERDDPEAVRLMHRLATLQRRRWGATGGGDDSGPGMLP